jgi:hypothetical protein
MIHSFLEVEEKKKDLENDIHILKESEVFVRSKLKRKNLLKNKILIEI